MIRFGTDGWRAVIGEGFTLENVRRIGRAVAGYLRENEGRLPGRTDRVVIGHDTRGLGTEASLALAEVLATHGIRATLAQGVVPTPAVSLAVKDQGLALGLMVTASHNPARFNGVKLKAHYGGSALPEIYEAVARKIDAAVHAATPAPPADEADFLEPYLDYVAGSVDADVIRNAGLSVGWDPMHGATCSAFPALAGRLGLRFDMPFGTPEASFGGRDPEPIPRNLEPTRAHFRGGACDAVGIADGDGDRLGMLLSDGTFVSPHHILALLSLYVLEVKGWRKGIARTFSSSFWLDRIARSFGVPFYETGIGFKYLCPLLLEGKVSIAGEESGGVAFAPTLPERDALLTFFMVLEMLAHRRRSLAECLADLTRRFGELFYDRRDVECPVDQGLALAERLMRHPPAEVAGRHVTETRGTDGVKFLFGKEGWLLFRASGTEPLLRIYSEMPSREVVAEVLDAAQRLARRELTA